MNINNNMTYTSKYEVGETVWALIDSRLEQREIEAISIHQQATTQTINYYFKVECSTRERHICVPEARLSKSRTVILKRLLLDSEE